MHFEWNDVKASVNAQKHGVSFEEALSCFFDPLQVAFDDLDSSEHENREILIGHSKLGRLLLVSYTVRKDVIRIISARKATQREVKDYARGI